MKSLTVAIAGVGGIHGAAAASELAKRGCRVLGFDLNARGHANGSSHGRSRIIRLAYSESPNYVALLQRAFQNWRRTEEETGKHLLTQTGALMFSSPGGHLVSGAVESAKRFNLDHRYMTAAQVNEAFPGFNLAPDMEAFFETVGGVLDADMCVAAFTEQAEKLGAELHFSDPVQSYEKDGDGLRVHTAKQSYLVDRLVLSAGPWINDLMGDFQLPLQVVRQVVASFQPKTPELYSPDRFPVYYFEAPEGMYYGFPNLVDEGGVKIGRHDLGENCTALNIRRDVDQGEIDLRHSILAKYLPGAAGQVVRTATCIYTNTPDRNFVIGLHRDNGNVVYGSCCGGHGFKFGSVIGEIYADLALNGKTDLPIAFLSADRFVTKV